MAMSATRMAWRASGETLRFSSISQKTSPSATVFLNAPKSTTTLIQKRSFFASLGGTTALFVGASVLTVVETVLFIVRAVLEAVYRRVHRIQYKP